LHMILRHPASMIGSDSWALAPYGILGKDRTHPRMYGCYPRILAKYVREKGVLTLEEAIKKMSSFPAQILGLQDRGLLKESMWADMVVFNPKMVADKATVENPNLYPQGIEYVLVNGEIVIEEGEHTGALPGKVLRSSQLAENKEALT